MNKFGLIGHPLGHSMSPLIHEKLFALAAYGLISERQSLHKYSSVRVLFEIPVL